MTLIDGREPYLIRPGLLVRMLWGKRLLSGMIYLILISSKDLYLRMYIENDLVVTFLFVDGWKMYATRYISSKPSLFFPII